AWLRFKNSYSYTEVKAVVKEPSLMYSRSCSKATTRALTWQNLLVNLSSQHPVLKRPNYLSTTTRTYIRFKMIQTYLNLHPMNPSWLITNTNRHILSLLKDY